MSNLKRPWPGHHPVTVYALQGLSKRCASVEPLHAENVLFVACAFRAAVAFETLEDFLGGEILRQLQDVQAACTENGAHAVLSILQRQLDVLSMNRDPSSAKRVAIYIQAHLARAVGDMDELISAMWLTASGKGRCVNKFPRVGRASMLPV